MKNRKRLISIRNRLMTIMLLVALLQGIVCCGSVIVTGGMNYLRESASSELVSTTATRRSNIENLLLNKWENLSDYQDTIQQLVEEQLNNSGKTVEDIQNDNELNRDILLTVSDEILDMLRYNSTTEAYIILNGYGDTENNQSRNALCIRNLEQTTDVSREALLVEVGPSEVAKSLGLTMDSYWNSKVDLDDTLTSREFYDTTIASVEKYSEYDESDLGYWGERFRWSPNDISVFSYSVPLVQDGVVYGILGITVSEEYIMNQLPYSELSSINRGTYVLAENLGENKYRGMAVSGVSLHELEEAAFTIEPMKDISGLYTIDATEDMCGSIQHIQLYERTSPYYGERLAVIGALPESALFETIYKLGQALLFAFLASVLIGIVGAYVGSYSFTKPIRNMVIRLKKNKEQKTITFPQSDVYEINELARAITSLNENVRDNAEKVAQVIELTNMPLGVIEYNRKLDMVFCTPKIIDLFGMDEEKYKDRFLSRTYFEEVFEKQELSYVLSEDVEMDYCVKNIIPQKWLQIKSICKKDQTLLAVIDITKDVYTRKKIEYERDYDILTHLLNRRAFKRQAIELIENIPNDQLGAMIMWDLDNLKYVNDTYGHDYGDQYIQKAGSIFGTLALDGAIVGRISGDEFLAFIPKCEDKKFVMGRMNYIKEKLNQSKVDMPDGEAIVVRASGGVAWYPEDGDNYAELMRHADFAMYETKNSYKGNFKEFNKEKYDRDVYLLKGREQLNRILEDEQVQYAFQPIVSTKDGSIFGYEALMRPIVEGLNNPSDVVRLASMQSRLMDLEKLTFKKALTAYMEKRDQFNGVKIFINSLPNQVLTTEDLSWFTDKYTFNPKKNHLVVEIIEYEQAEPEAMNLKLQRLKELNAQIAIDDFGAGYSSENTLLYIQPNYVKIDMNLTRDVNKDKDRQAIIANTVKYCVQRGIGVIAEGVETYEELRTIISLGVDYVQGYYLGRPDIRVKQVEPSVVVQIRELQNLLVDKDQDDDIM